jgi:hypothetical protein
MIEKLGPIKRLTCFHQEVMAPFAPENPHHPFTEAVSRHIA